MARKVVDHRGSPGGVATGQWRTWQDQPWAERPDPSRLQVWCYTDQPSYSPGDVLTVHVSTSAPTFDLRIVRDDGRWQEVFRVVDLPGTWYDTSDEAPSSGCDWPAAHRMTIPGDWPSGGYVVIASAADGRGRTEQDGFFALRASGVKRADTALILSTYTWAAYNDWGGASFYSETRPDRQLGFSPELSLRRPWARGTIRVPKGAPRVSHRSHVPIGWAVRQEWTEWAFAHGYAHWSACAGWARYERLLLTWLTGQGIACDVLTQWDLDRDPQALAGYSCVITCGHDEYWSAPGRDLLRDHIRAGGGHARFAGNILWQVAVDVDAQRLRCCKFREDLEPDLPPAQRTGAFESQRINSPPVTEFGANGGRGGYAGWGGVSPRGVGGFIVYRPQHWLLSGCDLYYGDVIGSEQGLVGYEVDGVDYRFELGLPYPTGADGTPPELEIVALTPTSWQEEDHGNPGSMFDPGDHDLRGLARLIHGDDTPALRARMGASCAVMSVLRQGAGEIICCGTTEWAAALSEGEPMTEQITRTALARLTEDHR